MMTSQYGLGECITNKIIIYAIDTTSALDPFFCIELSCGDRLTVQTANDIYQIGIRISFNRLFSYSISLFG